MTYSIASFVSFYTCNRKIHFSSLRSIVRCLTFIIKGSRSHKMLGHVVSTIRQLLSVECNFPSSSCKAKANSSLKLEMSKRGEMGRKKRTKACEPENCRAINTECMSAEVCNCMRVSTLCPEDIFTTSNSTIPCCEDYWIFCLPSEELIKCVFLLFCSAAYLLAMPKYLCTP